MMKNAKDCYEKLREIAEEIMSYYNMMSYNELKLGTETAAYQECYKWLIDAIARENSIYLEAQRLGFIDEIRMMVESETEAFPNLDNVLKSGFAYLFRIQNILEGFLKNDTAFYAKIIKYDINRILFSFLSEMQNNPYYDSIRGSLIDYKYSLLYSNTYSENDFITGKSISDLDKLMPPNEHKSYSMYHYVDAALLELPCLRNIDYLKEVDLEVFSDFKFSTLVIKIINILARLILSNEKLVSKYYQELNDLLEDEDCPEEIKKVFGELFQLLENIQSNILRGR